MARRPISPDLRRLILNAPTFQMEVSSYISTTGTDAREAQEDVLYLVSKTFYRKGGVPKNYQRMSRKPTGPLARFLVKVGLRSEGDRHNVGETPRRRKRR